MSRQQGKRNPPGRAARLADSGRQPPSSSSAPSGNERNGPTCALAQSIMDAQTNEIALMQELLQRKGCAPVPDTPGVEHGTMMP